MLLYEVLYGQFLILLCQQDAHRGLPWHAPEEFSNAC